jgi:hypothetical protein
MRCGSKCFIVHYEEGGQMKQCEVNARTPIEVRKVMKHQLGNTVIVKKVHRKNIK